MGLPFATDDAVEMIARQVAKEEINKTKPEVHLKTINGESLIGDGNIEVGGGVDMVTIAKTLLPHLPFEGTWVEVIDAFEDFDEVRSQDFWNVVLGGESHSLASIYARLPLENGGDAVAVDCMVYRFEPTSENSAEAFYHPIENPEVQCLGEFSVEMDAETGEYHTRFHVNQE